MRGTLHSFTALFSSCAESEDKRASVSRQHCFLEILHAYVEFNAPEEPNISVSDVRPQTGRIDIQCCVFCYIVGLLGY